MELFTSFEFVHLLCFSMMVGSVSTQTGEEKLTYLNNYPYNNVYRYQARCSLPCQGSYPPGTFNVTVVLDKICSNFDGFGNFKAAQTSSSAVWYLVNTNYVNSNSQNRCEFDLQFEHSPKSPVPTGTCRLGLETPTSCPGLQDVEGDVKNGWMTCFDVVTQELDACYNQTLFSQCCSACNDYRTQINDCPFGDFRPWQCTSVSDEQCYNQSLASNCCETCYDIATDRTPKIDGCRYGDRDPYYCSTYLEPNQCYQYAEKCCEACYWLSDTSKPDCLYGNRSPSLCYTITMGDCYNTTIERECCGTCSELRNNKYPDCPYGDKSSSCVSIDRNDCYRSTTQDKCCDTCIALANNNSPECAYGDRRDCYGVTPVQCTDATVQEECCETCSFLKGNNCPANEQPRCYYIESRDCYDTNTLQDCCYTCLDYYINNSHLSENCKYGDRKPNECRRINTTECYDRGVEFDCCETCSYSVRSDLPYACRYGDKENSCHAILPYQCYEQSYEENCCDTCTYYDQSSELGAGCKYGDRRFDCYTDGAYICYDPDEKKECCKYCQNLENPDNVGCEYGDKAAKCPSITAKDCYDLENTCCRTCPHKVSPYKIDNCKYGDRRNCTGLTRSACYDTTTALQCCQTCWLYNNGNTDGCAFGDSASDCAEMPPWGCYTRESQCCDTCEQHLTYINDITYCKYGNRHDNCSSIAPHQCYLQGVQYECCYTCYNKRRSDLPDTCMYGDKTDTCSTVTKQNFECYNPARRGQCCESCLKVQTNNRNCEYGDKLAMCTDVAQKPYLCYNSTIANLCCVSCPQYKDTAYPGCEYGDSYPYCRTSNCATYTSQRRQECCRTCWLHSGSTAEHTTSYSTYPTSDPSSTTEEGSGDTDQKGSSNKVALIVGGVVGGVILVAICVIAACFVMRRKKTSGKPKRNGLNVTALDPQRPTRDMPSYFNSMPNGGQGLNNPGYKSRVQSSGAQNGVAPPNRPPPKRQKSIKDEEVYDYIDDSDVRTVIIEPAKPAVPFREQDTGGYLQPTGNGDAQYLNPAYQSNEPGKEEHHYHILEANSQYGENMNSHEYLKL